MVFYRKYRPQKIEDLDSEAVRESIYSAFSGNSFTHAFLFTGPKGLGKTSTARIIAKVINCEKHHQKSKIKNQKSKLEIEPCNKCEQCVSITSGNNMDVLEIDGASNRGIDEIRDLRDKVKLAPFKAQRKVYIIDEVHMLTTEAFNALLKTLEEPPAHVVFIFCTTEPHKVPATILSRCFQIMFRKATEEELTRSFLRIAKGEKIQTDKEGLRAIAHLSDGSFRDGAKILEEMVLLSNGRKITKELVEKKYKLTNVEKQVTDLLVFLKEKDSKMAFGLISEIAESGVDVKYFLEQLIGKLHLILLEKVGAEEKNSALPALEIYEIKKLVELFSKAYLDTKYAVLEQLPLELAVVEWTSGGADNGGPVSGFPPVSAPNPTTVEPSAQSVRAAGSPSTRATPSGSAKTAPRALNEDKTNTALGKLWEELIEKVKFHNHSIAGVLRGCSIKSYDDGKLTIETGFKFHKERLEDGKTRKILEDVMQEITGDKASVSVLLRG